MLTPRQVAAVFTRRAAAEPRATAAELGHSLTTDELRELVGPGVFVGSYDEAFADPDTPLLPCVFLWRARPDYGHWCAAWHRETRGGGRRAAVFDSYGEAEPDAWRLEQDPQVARALGQDETLLLDSVVAPRAAVRALEWNDHPLQERDPRITTCGRWCALRLAFPELTPEGFAAAVRGACTRLNCAPDDLVVRLLR